MNETQFLSDLRKRLVESNVDSSDADKYAEQFKRYFDNLSEDEVDEQMSSVDSMDSIVNNLVALIEAKKMRRMQNEGGVSDNSSSVRLDGKEDTGDALDSAEPSELCSTASEATDNMEISFSDDSLDDEPSDLSESDALTSDDSDGHNEVQEECSALKFDEDAYLPDADETAGGLDGVDSSADSCTESAFPVNDDDSSAVTGEFVPVKTSDCAEYRELKPEIVGGGSEARVICGNSRIGKRDDAEYGVKTETFSEAVAFDEGFFFEDELSNAAYNAAYNDTYSDDEFVIPSEPGPHDAIISATRGRLPERRKSDSVDEYDCEEELTGIRKYIYRSPARIWADINSETGKKRFWGISLGTLPVTIPLAIILLGLFAGAFAVLAGVILTMIAGLIAVTVAGSAFSLISVVYGITQLFSTVPVGVYEIGVGIISAGITILAGILIYNAAVRLMPVAIGYLIRFFFYTVDRIKGLVYHFREECAKLK